MSLLTLTEHQNNHTTYQHIAQQTVELHQHNTSSGWSFTLPYLTELINGFLNICDIKFPKKKKKKIA